MVSLRINKVIANPYKVIPYLASKGLLNKLSDKFYLKLMFRARIGKKLNIKNPETFNEKIQWLKLHDRKEYYSDIVDKLKVRDYISETIGESYLTPLINVYDDVEQIDFDSLPNKFVLKCTHDSGGVVVCDDKRSLNVNKAKRKLKRHLKSKYFYHGREWPYKNVVPKVICEEYIEHDVSEGLIDYKLMCFNGKVKCSFVCLERNSSDGLKVDFYNLDWNLMPFERQYKNSGSKITKPLNYELMINLAERLAKEFSFMRVDFYEVKGKLYFGEMTFHPGSGFEKFKPYEYDVKLGNWITLPKT